MAAEPILVLTPIGRLVTGHPMEEREQKNLQTGEVKKGEDGEPETRYFMGLAFPKNDPGFAAVWQKMQEAARRDWPGGEFNSPSFAWKLVDGDGNDRNGKPYSSRTGYAGCYILKMSSGFAFPVVDEKGTHITEPKRIKRGYYLRAQISLRGNNPSRSPGIYVNVQFAQLCAFGEEIQSGPDVQAVLAANPMGALPAGASAVPVNAGMPGSLPATPGSMPAMMPGMGAPPGAGVPAPTAVAAHASAIPPAGMPIGAPSMPSAMPGAGGLPSLPAAAPSVPVVAPAPFPPEGWTVHPQNPAFYYKGTEVKSEADLRAMSGQLIPHPGILTPQR